jgi:adenosine kinase
MIMAKTTREYSKKFALNLSSAGMLGIPAVLARVQDLLPYCDFVFGNEAEFQALADMCEWNDSNNTGGMNECAMQHVLARIKPGGCVCQTRGGAPTVVLAASDNTGANTNTTEKNMLHKAPRLVTVPTQHVSPRLIKDSNGAGDCFVGGFLAGVLCGLDSVQSAEVGNHCAAINIQHTGCVF